MATQTFKTVDEAIEQLMADGFEKIYKAKYIKLIEALKFAKKRLEYINSMPDIRSISKFINEVTIRKINEALENE